MCLYALKFKEIQVAANIVELGGAVWREKAAIVKRLWWIWPWLQADTIVWNPFEG